jgi:hypothetical protein
VLTRLAARTRETGSRPALLMAAMRRSDSPVIPDPHNSDTSTDSGGDHGLIVTDPQVTPQQHTKREGLILGYLQV